jgi:prophage maintenance system killer protein
MGKSPAHLQEVLFGSSDKKESRHISLYVKRGVAKKIAPRLYTTNLTDSCESIVRRNWFRILAEKYPAAVLSHRSALEGRPTPEGHLFLTYRYTKNVELPGLSIHFQKGQGKIEGDKSLFGELYLSQEARAYLENLQISRNGLEASKILTREELEHRLEALIKSRGEAGINELLDRARSISVELQMEMEFSLLNNLVSALLKKKPGKIRSSAIAKARALGEPFDPARISLFEQLYESLAGRDFPIHRDKNETMRSYQNFAFFESYFSNYIEGTIFEIEEAKQIILTETPLPARTEDSHDVLGTYKLVSNMREMATCPRTAEELIQILRYRHNILLSAHHEKNPGMFKDRNTRAANTEFVDWTLVKGTLKKGYEWYQLLQHAFAKSAYIMFLISEIHPFIDGNGRLARVMMNAELSSRNLSKIMVPTVFREEYKNALQFLSRSGDTGSYIRVLLKLYAFSSTITGENLNEMERYLRSRNAFADPGYLSVQF